MSIIKCFNCGEYGHFAHDCPKAHNNANIAQEREQKASRNPSEECAMVCTELQYEDASEDEVMVGDQQNSTAEYEKATYGDLMKTQNKRRE